MTAVLHHNEEFLALNPGWLVFVAFFTSFSCRRFTVP